MRYLLLAICVAASLGIATGRSLPLTLKEITLMLHSGYSSEAVQHELSVRHLAEACDEAAEKALRNAGATPALIDAIRSGTYASSSADAQAALEESEAQKGRQIAENERLRKMDVAYQKQRARANANAVSQAPGQTSTAVADLLKGDVVRWGTKGLTPVDDETIQSKKLFALYFSAHWCGPCRQFTPRLVEFYNRVAPQHPEFEVIFISNDRSPYGMETYLHEMPWPAIEFAKIASKGTLTKYAGDGIPCLVVVNASGQVVFDTYVGKDRIGPEKVLKDLDALFAKG
jgi:nucleoredoxin